MPMLDVLKNKQVLVSVLVSAGVVLIAFGLTQFGSHGDGNRAKSTETNRVRKYQPSKVRERDKPKPSTDVALDAVKPPNKSSSDTTVKHEADTTKSVDKKSVDKKSDAKLKGDLNAPQTLAADATDSGTADVSKNPTDIVTDGGYTDATVADQAKMLDTDPAYLKDTNYMLNMAPLKIGDKLFAAGGKNMLYMYNKKADENYTFILESAMDWALFKGQLNLSDDDYTKVVKYYNTTKKYIEDNHIEIIGTGG